MGGQVELKGLRGWLHWREEADGVVFQAEAEDLKDGLYKVYITLNEEERLLGTLIPEGGRLKLRRKLSRRELGPGGGQKIRKAEARLAFAFEDQKKRGQWQQATGLEALLRDPILKTYASKLNGALMCRDTSGIRLAVPFSIHAPFPLVPLICLGKSIDLNGSSYLCFSFDREGILQCEKNPAPGV